MLGPECPRGAARRDPDPLAHREEARAPPQIRPGEKPRRGKTRPDPRPGGEALWTALRAWRLEEARHQEVPPYVIFHDTTLIEVARRRPTTLAALSEIPGIGRSKLDRYGEAVLAVITDAMERISEA